MDVEMVVIPDPPQDTELSILTKGPGAASPFVKPEPLFVGAGPVNYVCGRCKTVLARGLTNASELSNLVLHCPACGAHNATRS